MSEKKTVGVILSGSGFLDGAEIQEAVLVLLALSKAGAEAKVCAPDAKLEEIDHFTGKPTGQMRSVLSESARIARCNIYDLATVKGADVDAWIMPGGYGAAKNLSDFATKGAAATVNKDVGRIVREAFAAQIPIGACCIAPAILAAASRQVAGHLRLTIGNDSEVAKQIASMGHIHVECKVEDIVVDNDRKVVTAPAYMYGDAPVHAVAAGIDKMVAQVLAWA